MKMVAGDIQLREDGDIISLTLPPSQYIRTVTVTKGVQTPNHVRVTENPPAGPPVLVFLSRLSARGDMIAGNASPTNDIVNPGSKPSTQEVDDKVSNIPTLMAQRSVENVHTATTASLAVDIGMDTLTLGDPVGNQGTPTPSQHPPPSHLRECPTHERFNVSKEVQKLYPPLVLGWKNRSWVVVIRGCDIGIFYDFWARIWPLIKYTEDEIIPGAHWKKAEGESDAMDKWMAAVDEGITDRL